MTDQLKEEKKELDQEKLKELAFIDDLTGIYNRRYLYRHLPAKLKEIQLEGKRLCLFMMDIDNFKEINDTYGHLCGDSILVAITQILRKNVREKDLVIRYAGDEFIAILPETEEKTALKIAKRIIENVDKNHFRESEDKPSIHVTISIGLALCPRDAQDPERLIYQADRALYSSKRAGRNRICAIKDIPGQIWDTTKMQEIFLSPQLIARQAQLNKLNQLLVKTKEGKANFILIKGERGIGKTRFMSEFKQQAPEEGISKSSVLCSPKTSNQPYQILIKALENQFVLLGNDVVHFIRSLPEAQTVQLAKYIPTISQFLPEKLRELKVSQDQKAQAELFKGICQSLIYFVKRNTLILIIDDFHWIDQQTLQLFRHIVKELRHIPIFIVAAYREEELEGRSDEPSLKELLQQMVENELAEELALEALEKEDILKMITLIFADIDLHREFVDVIYDVSAGNPLFTEEALRALVNKGFIFFQNGKWHTREVTEGALPPFLKEAIQKRIIELDEETKPVISAAAVIGEVFDFDVLCKLIDKDPGYILEAVDRAIKQHLIVSDSPFQTDKFKFSSEGIWDIIYSNLDAREKQELHRRLALIEENTYKNNIDSVAGDLGYHFGKAQDLKKADFYSNMLLEKTSHMPEYEDVFGFLQEILTEKAKEEEEEEEIAPLCEEGMRLLPALVRYLKLAVQNFRLYPPQSIITKDLVEQAYRSLTNIMAKDSTLVIAMTMNRLLINGEEISEKTFREAGAGIFLDTMDSHRLRSITFKKHLLKEELAVFLEALSQRLDDLIPEGGLTGFLRKKAISHIKVNEVCYQQAKGRTKRRAKFEEAMLIDYLIGKVSNLGTDRNAIATELIDNPQSFAGTFQKIAENTAVKEGEDKIEVQAGALVKGLQRLDTQISNQTSGGPEQYHKKIAEAMMALDYKLIFRVIQTLENTKIGGSKNLVENIIQRFSDKEILERLKKEFSDSQGNLERLRVFLHRFLSDPQRKPGLLPKLKKELLQLHLGEEEVAWVLQENIWQGLPLKEKVQRLTRFPAESYVKLEISKQTDSLFTQLLNNGQYKETGEIIDKLLRQLEDGAEEVRSVTLKDLNKISAILILKEKFFLLDQIIHSLIIRLDKEKAVKVYSLLTRVLAAICVSLIKKENFIQATEILSEFNVRLQKETILSDVQRLAIKDSKDKLISSVQLINRLVKLLETRIEMHHDFWELSKIIVQIGAATISPMFSLALSERLYADPFKIYALRWSIAKVLKEMSSEAVIYLKDKLSDENPQYNKVALELLGHMQETQAVKYLRPLLKHEDLGVRKETINTLGKIGNSEAIRLLSECIRDKNKEIRSTSIWALANIATPEVIPILKTLVKEKVLFKEIDKIIQRIEGK